MALALPVVGSAFSPCLTSRSWFRKSAAPSTNGRLSASYKASESSSGNVELPNGVYWLDRAAHNHDVVYGQNFVLQRWARRGGEGLVLSNQPIGMQVLEAGPSTAPLAGPSISQQQRRRLPALLAGAPMDYLDITDYALVEDAHEDGAQQLAGSSQWGTDQEGPECTGMVVHSLFGGQQQDTEVEAAAHSRNPRRTQKVKFTCNLCGETTVKRVNPHAWANGTVFAECSGCHVKHKLIDNLKLFHELRGPVFSAPISPAIVIPSSLPQRPLLDFHQHPALFSMFDPDADPPQQQ